VAVLPPPGSRFGSACQTGLMITGATPTLSGGAGAIASALSVPLKATVPGKIVGADGAVVAGVSVAATPTAAASALNCGKAVLVSPPTSTTTDRDGTFQLMLDPGTYQFDYDPAAGSSVPRLTETKLAVSAGGNDMRLVRMLPGALIKGLVQDASGAPLPQAGVRFLEVACVGQSACYGANRVSPILRGDTHTDADGTFRVVVPAQMP
jgi:hypothetical protein